jgi:hypothetical protein
MVLASAQRCRPAWVLGPVLRPPWVLHTRLPLRAGAAHCSFVRLDLAWQRWQVTRPPSVLSVCSKCKVCVFMGCTRCRVQGESKFFFIHRTSCTGPFLDLSKEVLRCFSPWGCLSQNPHGC